MARLATLFLRGEGVTADTEKALELNRQAAARGHSVAQMNAAHIIEKTSGDRDEIFHFLKLAADQGFTEAETSLAQCFERGFGVEKDLTEAMRWYARAAAKGHEESIAALDHVNERLDNLADMMKRDGYYLDAARHYKLSVEQTASLHAMYHLGEMNYNGQGFDSRNYDEARRLWERAAAGGHEGAIAALAATAQHYAEDD
mmetsp:Transcript_32032/g.104067  ORF Transcript_32032/g.104067 Transcript_32032/m.104067 type:complete len:201 (-) Transcript_32032:13-615(-)